MATTRATGFVVDAATWNNVLAGLSDAGILASTHGGTGLTTFTAAGRIPYATSAEALTTSTNFTYDGTTFTVGTVSTNHAFTGAGNMTLKVRNTAAGTANSAVFQVVNDNSVVGALKVQSSTYTPSGEELADGVVVKGTGVGGLSVAATHASGDVRCYSRGSNLRITIDGTAVKVASGFQFWLPDAFSAAHAGAMSYDGTMNAGELYMRDSAGTQYRFPVWTV